MFSITPSPISSCTLPFRKPTFSQKLTELASRIDFREFMDEDEREAEPAAKKGTQKWPWELTHSKLKCVINIITNLSSTYPHT